jgi:hypothetical protein
MTDEPVQNNLDHLTADENGDEVVAAVKDADAKPRKKSTAQLRKINAAKVAKWRAKQKVENSRIEVKEYKLSALMNSAQRAALTLPEVAEELKMLRDLMFQTIVYVGDCGINPYERTHYSDTSESDWARGVREGREKHVAENKKRERDAQRYKETHQTVLTANGHVSYAQSTALNKAAAQRHAEEDARESGKPVPVATGFRVIPADEIDFYKYAPEEIKAYLAAKRGGRYTVARKEINKRAAH